MTRGKLLRVRRWEAQVKQSMPHFSDDDVSAVALKPRMMLSHLRATKASRARGVPARFQALQALVDAMDIEPGSRSVLSDAQANENSDEQSDDVQEVLVPHALAPCVDVSSEEGEAADVDALLHELEEWVATPRKKTV